MSQHGLVIATFDQSGGRPEPDALGENIGTIKNAETLIPQLYDSEFRHAYFEKLLKAYIANQIRALRGDDNQTEFGAKLGMTQSVVSRLEDEDYGKLNTQTLVDIAKKLELGLLIQFVSYDKFLEATDDMSPDALRPAPFDAKLLERLIPRPPLPKQEVATFIYDYLGAANAGSYTHTAAAHAQEMWGQYFARLLDAVRTPSVASHPSMSDLLAENKRLREENARLKAGQVITTQAVALASGLPAAISGQPWPFP